MIKFKNSRYIIQAVASIILLILLVLNYTGDNEIKDNDSLTIGSKSIQIKDIKYISLEHDIYLKKVVGLNNLRTLRGTFRLEDDTKAYANIYRKEKSVIKVETLDKKYIFNLKNEDDTNNLYKEIKKLAKPMDDL